MGISNEYIDTICMNTESTEENKNRKIGRIIAIIVAVIVIGALIVGGARKKTDSSDVSSGLPEGCKPGFLFSETTGKPCPQTETPSVDTATTEGVLNTSGYEAAIRSYAGKVVIFDASCKAVSMISSPITAGTRILVANNSDKQLDLSVAGKSEKLDAYHYFTTTLKSAGDTQITCDAKTAATIKVK
jgi:cell division septation protein DedD